MNPRSRIAVCTVDVRTGRTVLRTSRCAIEASAVAITILIDRSNGYAVTVSVRCCAVAVRCTIAVVAVAVHVPLVPLHAIVLIQRIQ